MGASDGGMRLCPEQLGRCWGFLYGAMDEPRGLTPTLTLPHRGEEDKPFPPLQGKVGMWVWTPDFTNAHLWSTRLAYGPSLPK